jgi:hypothetical protein
MEGGASMDASIVSETAVLVKEANYSDSKTTSSVTWAVSLVIEAASSVTKASVTKAVSSVNRVAYSVIEAASSDT